MRYLPILLTVFCVACGSYSANMPSIKPYKMDIQQGNVVTPKMMMQLRPGMTKSQVRFIMGTPLLVDSFHADRWDYFYQMRKQGKIIEQRRVILEFDGDTLSHVRGDVIPAGSDASAPAEKSQTMQPKTVVKPAPAKEKGMLDKLKFWGDDAKDQPKAQPEPAKTEEASKPVKTEETKPATAPKSVPASQQESEPAPVEAPLPPLVDEAQQPKPEPMPAAKPEPKPEAKPVKQAPEAAKPAAEPQEEKKGWIDKLKFWGDDEKAQPKTVPAPKPAEAPKPAPARVESKPQPPVEKVPAPKTKVQPEVKPKAPPQPPADLPPEDAPEFFEKMLEKIGF